MVLRITTITTVPIMVMLVMAAAVTANILLLPVVMVNAQQLAQSENIPNPETNGDITIQSGLYPDPDAVVNRQFIFDLSTFQMSFSKQNLSQFSVMYLPGVEPILYTGPTFFRFGLDIQIPEQQSSGNTMTYLKHVNGWLTIYKVQEFPELNERHYYGRGHVSVENQTWANSEGVLMEKTKAPFYYGIYVKGKP